MNEHRNPYFETLVRLMHEEDLESLDEAAIQIISNQDISNQRLLDYCILFLNRYS